MSIESMINKVKGLINNKNTAEIGSNYIEPTEDMVKKVIELYLEGKDLWSIRTSVYKEGTKLKLSDKQIIEIIEEYKKQTASVIEEKKVE